jgi:hypothetical protein
MIEVPSQQRPSISQCDVAFKLLIRLLDIAITPDDP